MKMISFHKDVMHFLSYLSVGWNKTVHCCISLTSQKTRRLDGSAIFFEQKREPSCCHVFVLQQGKPGCYKFNISFFQKSDFSRVLVHL